MPDHDLLEVLLKEEVFKNVAAIAAFLGHKSPSHLYRIRKGDGNLSERDRFSLIEHRERLHRPAPVFSPQIEDAGDVKWLILESEKGGKVKIPLELREGRWVITSPAFDIFWEKL